MIVCISGSGFAGTGALMDYFREIDTVRSSSMETRFAVEYDGLLDLEFHLCKQISGYQSGDLAVRRFLNFMDVYAKKAIRDAEQRRKFLERVDQYVDSLVQIRWKGLVPNTYLTHMFPQDQREQLPLFRLRQRLARALYTSNNAPKPTPSYYVSRARRKLSRIVGYKKIPSMEEFEHVLSVDPDHFLAKTRSFVKDIVDILVPGDQTTVILKQAVTFSDPTSAFHFFENPKAIVMRRDLRDIYAILKYQNKRQEFIPFDTVADFVKYYRILYGEAKRAQYDETQVLNIWFEDLIYQYDETTEKIDSFIGIEHVPHSRERFDPRISGRNTRLYERYPEGAADFEYIAENMKEYLYPFEKYPRFDLNG